MGLVITIPKDVDTIFNKAFVLGINLKNYDEALRLTEENLEKHPKHKGLLCLTAEIYKETGIEGICKSLRREII